MSDIAFRLTGGTNVGLVRTNNEDNFIVNADLTKGDWFIPSDTMENISLGEAGSLFVVADGMGGMNAGEVASEIAIESVKAAFSKANFKKILTSDKQIQLFLQKTIEKADSNIKAKVKEDNSTAGMGTTIVIAWVHKDVVHISWCGDSRAYLFNSKSGMVRLSKDHSYVQQLVDEGKLDAELAFDHPNSNIITRSLGDTQVKANPDYISKNISEGDMILLCSDGLCGLCRDEEIMSILEHNSENIEQCKNELIAAALEAGGYDNVTVALFQVVSVEKGEELGTDTFSDFRGKRGCKGLSKKGIAICIGLVLIVLIIIGAYFYLKNNNPELLDSIIASISKIFEGTGEQQSN